jgi:hypothetical protein
VVVDDQLDTYLSKTCEGG